LTLPDQNSGRSKKEQVASMFDSIAPSYDFLNHFLSFGVDRCWRKKLRKAVSHIHNGRILDIATGTGDLAFELLKLQPEKITGIDISEKMLAIAGHKAKRKNIGHIVEFQYGDSENLRFENDYFDLVTIAFGIRNFENMDKALTEIIRVMKKGGMLAILEFSKPVSFPFKQLYYIYFKAWLPLTGRIVSKHRRAYAYLPESVSNFPDGKAFMDYLGKAGFINIRQKRLTGGVATLYISQK
jgi:demethylmenaquinone methyltransferase/2-methoxy-6-polyprenyl-1,4-benzoquinol methylase